MAEDLRLCATECDDAATYLVDAEMRSFKGVSVHTAQMRIDQLKAFTRKLNLHKLKQTDDARKAKIREVAAEYSASNSGKKKN